MRLESAREAREEAFEAVRKMLDGLPRAASDDEGWTSYARESDAPPATLRALRQAPRRAAPRPLVSVGIAPTGDARAFRLAVRVQRENPLTMMAVDAVTRVARGEIDMRFIGKVRRSASTGMPPPGAARARPLVLGASVAHFRATAGSVGGFLRSRENLPGVHLLSNNHVIANENRCKPMDASLQPAPLDGGRLAADRVAGLSKWISLKKSANTVDCAMAGLDAGVDYDASDLGLGRRLAGVGAPILQREVVVHKVGRKTGATSGRVTAFELKGLAILYQAGPLVFDDQLEIEGLGDAAFASRGDSGALVVDDDHLAVGLFFASSDAGGANGKGLAYANLFTAVLDELKADLIC